MNRYSALLLLDDEDSSAGTLALSLLRRGYDVVYANDLDELALVKKERGEAALLLAAPSETLIALAAPIQKKLDVPPQRMVVVGELPDPSAEKMLSEVGVRWCLSACEEERDEAYLLAAAYWEMDPDELRFQARAPIQLEAILSQAGRRFGVRVGDVSAGGLGLLDCPALDAAQPVEVWFRLASEDVERRATLIWASEASEGVHARAGLRFETPESLDRPGPLQQHVDAWLSRHRIPAPAGASRCQASSAAGEAAERRAHDRTPTSFDALYTTADHSGAGRLVNLSQAGCLLEAASVLPEVGAVVQVYVFVQPVAPFELSGCVVRHAGTESFGLEFKDLEPDARHLIDVAALEMVKKSG